MNIKNENPANNLIKRNEAKQSPKKKRRARTNKKNQKRELKQKKNVSRQKPRQEGDTFHLRNRNQYERENARIRSFTQTHTSFAITRVKQF